MEWTKGMTAYWPKVVWDNNKPIVTILTGEVYQVSLDGKWVTLAEEMTHKFTIEIAESEHDALMLVKMWIELQSDIYLTRLLALQELGRANGWETIK